MANEDIVGITINGENVANFSIPKIGYKVKMDEYQITHVGGVHEFSVALIKDFDVVEKPVTKEVALEIMKSEFPTAEQLVAKPAGEVVPIAEPAKKPRKPREPKAKASEEPSVVTTVVDEATTPRAEDPKVVTPPVHTNVSGDVNTARLPYLVKMIGFYGKAKEMKKEDITIELLKRDALDIVEKDNDATILAAIDSYKA